MKQLKVRVCFANLQFVLISLIVCGLALFVTGHEYLKEKPSFLQPCHLHDTDNSQCLVNAFGNFFTRWSSGVPGLKGLSPLDPFHLKRVRLSQQTSNLADIKFEFKNLDFHGLSDTKLLKMALSVNDKDYKIEMKAHTSAIDVRGDYKAKGLLLILNLDGVGKVTSTIANVDYHIIFKCELKQIDGLYFLVINSLSTQIDKVGDFKIHLTNLFGGNTELENAAHDLINNSWHELFEIMRPAVVQALNEIILDRYKRIMQYVPANYFFDDLP